MLITTMIKNNKNNTEVYMLASNTTMAATYNNNNHLMHPIYIANLFLIHHGASLLLEDFLANFFVHGRVICLEWLDHLLYINQ